MFGRFAFAHPLAAATICFALAVSAAWIAARIPYMQTEAFRFGNAIVDALMAIAIGAPSIFGPQQIFSLTISPG